MNMLPDVCKWMLPYWKIKTTTTTTRFLFIWNHLNSMKVWFYQFWQEWNMQKRDIHLRSSMWCRARVVGGHATIGRLSNNDFSTFQAIRNFLKKVAERSRDSGRRSRDRRPTVKQRFLDVSCDLGKFWKKSLNGHATVVGGHATVGRLSNNVFWTFQAIWENFEKSRRTVTRQWLRSRDRRPTVKQRLLDVSSN